MSEPELLTGAEASGLSATFRRSMATIAECLDGLHRITTEQSAEIDRLNTEIGCKCATIRGLESQLEQAEGRVGEFRETLLQERKDRACAGVRRFRYGYPQDGYWRYGIYDPDADRYGVTTGSRSYPGCPTAAGFIGLEWIDPAPSAKENTSNG